MDVQQRTFIGGLGWSQPLPAELDSPHTLVLIFAPPSILHPPSRLLGEIGHALPQALKLGCSTEAVIAGADMALDRAVVAVCQFHKTTLASAIHAIDSPADSFATGQALAKTLWRPDLRLLMLLADDTVLDANELMGGLNAVLPPTVLVTGGLAGHPDYATGKRVVITESIVGSKVAAAVGIYGDDLCVRQVSNGGWQNRSPVFEVTRAEGRTLYELNHRPAAEAYRRFLGNLAAHLTEAVQHMFPVGFYDQPDDQVRVVRSVLEVDATTGVLHFPAEVPAARYLRFMIGLPSQFVDSAARAAESAVQQFPATGDAPRLALMVSCVGRYFAMQEDAAKEAKAAFAKLGPHITQVGFYGHGEIAPSGRGGCELHNHTVNYTVLGEK